MSTKRVTQTIVTAEVKSSGYNRVSQDVVDVEVVFPTKMMNVSQALVTVEVLIGPPVRIAGAATQCT